MKRVIISIAVTLFSLLSHAQGNTAKYVFYFIGDGMGPNHVTISGYYQAFLSGEYGYSPLSFAQFPVYGNASSYSASSLITDSSAAGTALSTGEKTDNGMLCVTPDKQRTLESISYKAHKAGYKVGISSTVGINHATPAAFYGHNNSRSNYYEIALQIPDSGFEFFAGGGIIESRGKDGKADCAYDIIEDSGYTIAEGLEEFAAGKQNSERMLLLQEDGKDLTSLPYAIDRKEGQMTQADLVRASIDFLYQEDGPGFFIMSEGGKIDWASHGNDTKCALLETISLSEAVEVALEFYRQHPEETLIVVTADHETGGLSMCWNRGYEIRFQELYWIQFSKDMASRKEKKKFDRSSQNAHIGWSSFDHSGANVPVFAIGAGCEYFSGSMDNTDIPKRICKAMNIAY